MKTNTNTVNACIDTGCNRKDRSHYHTMSGLVIDTNTNTEDGVKSHFIQAWGRKCSDFDENCACCIAWKWYEGAGREYLIELVRQKTIEAALEELKTVPLDTLVYGRAQPLTVSFRLAELQASLNTEGEDV